MIFKVSQGKAHTLDKWGGKSNHLSMAYLLSNNNNNNNNNDRLTAFDPGQPG